MEDSGFGSFGTTGATGDWGAETMTATGGWDSAEPAPAATGGWTDDTPAAASGDWATSGPSDGW